MKTKIAHAKQFAYNHRAKIVGAAGPVAGVVIGKNLPTQKAIAMLDITADQAKQITNDPNLCAEFETAAEHIFVFVNAA